MSKKIEIGKYTITVPVTMELQFRVVSDSKENALNIVKESNPHISLYGDSFYVADELYYTDNFEYDVLPYRNNNFVNPKLKPGYKWDDTMLKIGSDSYDFKNAKSMYDGCSTYYIPSEE